MNETTMYQLRVKLRGSKPEIWRRFEVPSNLSFYDLHDVLQVVMGWDDAHLFQFMLDDKTFADSEVELGIEFMSAEDNLLSDHLKVGETLIYEYDFGDSWEHIIKVEGMRPVQASEFPRCLDGARACPPEDSGGIYGYMHMLEVLNDPTDEEYEDIAGWMDEEFDAAAFDVNEVNEDLQFLLEEWGVVES